MNSSSSSPMADIRIQASSAGPWCTPDVLFAARSFKLKVTDPNAFNERILASSILIVDDNEVNAFLVKQILESAGFKNVHSESKPALVVTRIRSLKPDLIALDLQMLEVSGLEIMEILEAEVQSLHEGPLLVLTADTAPETKRRALELGADDYLTKPVDVSELCIRVSNLLAGFILRSQLEDQNTHLSEMVEARTAELERTNSSLELEMGVRQAADELLRRAEQRLRFLLLSSPNTLFSTEAEPPYRTTFVSENIFSLLGYTAEEFMRDPEFRDDTVHPADLDDLMNSLPLLVEKGSLSTQTRRLHKDQTYRWIQSDVAVILDSGGHPLEFVGSWTDISDRKVDELALASTASNLSSSNTMLKTAEERLRFLLTSSPTCIFSADPRHPFGINFISENVQAQLGYSAAEFTDDPCFWLKHIHPEDGVAFTNLMPTLLARGHFKTECRFLHRDNTYRWMQAERAVILDSNGGAKEVIGSWTDITERKATDAALAETATELSAANTRLLEFDTLKSEFVATASHEMRTPLTVIREFADLLSDGAAGDDPEEQAECYEAILRNCDRLTGMLDYLLDFQRIEAGKLTLRRDNVDAEDLLHRCHKDLVPKCANHQLTFDLKFEEGLPAILADDEQVMQVLVNLIGNAVKFTPEKGRVTLSAVAAGDFVEFGVEDTGRGIAEEHLETVFEAFRQIDRVEGPGFRGTGLGLTISNQIITMHGGRLSVESCLGKGTKFSFTIPQWTESRGLEALVSDKCGDSEGAVSLVLFALEPSTEEQLHALSAAAQEALQCFDGGMILARCGCVAFALERDEASLTDMVKNAVASISSALPGTGALKFKVAEVSDGVLSSDSLCGGFGVCGPNDDCEKRDRCS